MAMIEHARPRPGLTSAAPKGNGLAAEFTPAEGVDEQDLISMFMGARAKELEGEYEASDGRQIQRSQRLGNLAGLERARGAAEIQMDPTVRRGRAAQFEDDLPGIRANAEAKAYPEQVRGEYDVEQANVTSRGRQRESYSDNLSSQLESLRSQRYPKDRTLQEATPETPGSFPYGALGFGKRGQAARPNDQATIDQLDPRIRSLESQFGFQPEEFTMAEIQQEARESGQPVEAIVQELKRAGHVVR